MPVFKQASTHDLASTRISQTHPLVSDIWTITWYQRQTRSSGMNLAQRSVQAHEAFVGASSMFSTHHHEPRIKLLFLIYHQISLSIQNRDKAALATCPPSKPEATAFMSWRTICQEQAAPPKPWLVQSIIRKLSVFTRNLRSSQQCFSVSIEKRITYPFR